jgi:hypothetical protein
MDFNQFFKDKETAVKVEFLYLILVKNEGLRNQFIEYAKHAVPVGKSPVNEESSEDIIAEAFQVFNEYLEDFNFEDTDWENYIPRHNGYIPEYEAIEHMAEDELNDFFEGWNDEICSLIGQGQHIDAVCTILGTYDGCLSADIPGAHDVFRDFTETLLNYHTEMMNDAIKAITKTVISRDQAAKAADAVFDHFYHSYSDDKNYLKYFELLLSCLAETKEISDDILLKMKASGIDESWLPQLTVKLYSFKSDQTEWVKKAAQYFMNDTEVAKKLLDYYFANDVTSFLRDGKAVFAAQPDTFAHFLHERIYPDLDLDFFKKVLWHLAYREPKIELYEALRSYLDESEKQRFINEIRFDVLFCIKVLTLEKRFDEILLLAKKEAVHSWYFPEHITPILNIFPREAFDLIKFKITRTMEIEKGRNAYQRICTFLKLALQITGYEAENQHLIRELYNRRPALPALKDEMRKAGISVIS